MTRVAIVSLGRGGAMGEVRRVASWRQIFTAADAEVIEVPLAPDRRVHPDGLVPVVAGRAAPERLAWSRRHLNGRLQAEEPDAVVVVSVRAFDPSVVDGPWNVVLDLVDSLSRSYRDRAEVVDGVSRTLMYRSLAVAHQRVEARLRRSSIRRVAAGWTDARALGAEWVPIVADPSLRPLGTCEPDHDVLFFGTLRYPPNIDALERLARLWQPLTAMRPGTTALVAGSTPTARVEGLCRVHGWTLLPNFASLPAVAARARVAVAPLALTAGMQIKVLDSACLGLPQVVTPAALEGYEPGFPLLPQATDDGFAREIVRLLDDADAASLLVADTHRVAQARYGVESWVPWARSLLKGTAQSPT